MLKEPAGDPRGGVFSVVEWMCSHRVLTIWFEWYVSASVCIFRFDDEQFEEDSAVDARDDAIAGSGPGESERRFTEYGGFVQHARPLGSRQTDLRAKAPVMDRRDLTAQQQGDCPQSSERNGGEERYPLQVANWSSARIE